jgi:hypothetical protein
MDIMRKPLDLLKTSWGVRSSFLLSILLFFPTTLIAAVPTHQIDEAYIREWLVLGASLCANNSETRNSIVKVVGRGEH